VPLMLRIALARNLRRREELVLDLTTTTLAGDHRAEILEERIGMARRNPTPLMSVVRQLIAAAFWTAPGSVRPPVVFLGARGDRMVSPRCSHRLAKRLGGPIFAHPEGGHDLPLDDPGWVCNHVRDSFGTPA